MMGICVCVVMVEGCMERTGMEAECINQAGACKRTEGPVLVRKHQNLVCLFRLVLLHAAFPNLPGRCQHVNLARATRL